MTIELIQAREKKTAEKNKNQMRQEKWVARQLKR